MKCSKSAIIILLAVVISAMSSLLIITANAKTVDIDGDGFIRISDATEIQKVLAGLKKPSDNFYEIADADEDGKVGINDATYIQKYIAGIVDDEPTTKPTSEPATAPISEPATEPTSEPVTEPTSEPVTEPTSEPVTEPTTTAVYPSILTLNKTSITLGISEDYALIASCDAENCICTFSSDDSSVAEVTDEGVISAVGVGTTKIICSTENGLTDSCEVTVKPITTSLSLNKSTLTLGISEKFDFNSSIDIGTAAYHRYYYSDNPEIASVEKAGGLVTAKSVGTTTISCKMNNGMTAVCKLTVKKAPESVSINTKSVKLNVGKKYTISESTNSGSYAYGFEWVSSNPKVATVAKDTSNKAIITAVSQGTATITITTYNGKKAACEVTVNAALNGKKIYLSPSNQNSNTYATGDTNEMEQCDKIAAATARALERCGFSVMVGKSGDTMQNRCSESNKFGADIHMPIHTNAFNGSYTGGTRVFCLNSTGKNACDSVLKYLGAISPGTDDRMSYQENLYEINKPKGLAIYVECEFHDTTKGSDWIRTNTENIGEAICHALCDYYKTTYYKGNSSSSNNPTPDPEPSFKSYNVTITSPTGVNIRKGPGTNYAITGSLPMGGKCTIVDEKNGQGATKWGKLSNGSGWIALDYTKKV